VHWAPNVSTNDGFVAIILDKLPLLLAAGLTTNELVVGDVAQGAVVVDTATGWVAVGAINWLAVVVVLETTTG